MGVPPCPLHVVKKTRFQNVAVPVKRRLGAVDKAQALHSLKICLTSRQKP
jgi:hypothetical protein